MPKYKVNVEKRLYVTGQVEIEASSKSEAIELIQKQIDTGELQTTSVEWNDPQYEDCSFDVADEEDFD